MDRRTIIAIAICILILIAYPYLLKVAGLERYVRPTPPPRTAVVDTTRAATARGPAAVADTTAPAPVAAATQPAVTAAPFRPTETVLERAIEIDTPLYRAAFTNRGARLVSVELKHFAVASGLSHHRKRRKPGEELPPEDRVVLAGNPAFGLDLGSGPTLKSLAGVVYAVSESLDATGLPQAITFTARDSAGLTVRQTYRVRPGSYALDLEVEIRGVPLDWRLSDYSLTARSWPMVTEANEQADVRSLRATSLVGTNVHREHAGGLSHGPRTFEGSAEWAAVHTRYFMGAVAVAAGSAKETIASAGKRALTPEQLKLLPENTRSEQDLLTNSLVAGLPTAENAVQRFVVYFGPCDYFALARLKLELDRVVDLGWSIVLPFSKALLWLLNWIYAVLRNYGVAILVLATLVRVLLHPLNMASMKSMRAMQRLQPQLEQIKAKYKNDAQAMNTAVMALYKENKVNPAGGCLPMLVQMPLFFALYAVLYNAIELRQAPFVSWIDDLSAPDLLLSVGSFPVHLLPVLMAASGFLSQKVTPTDPRQAPTMYLMNLFMLVFFYPLPSGLVLYWTVMNLLTAIQQWLVLRQDDGALVPVAAAGGSGKGR